MKREHREPVDARQADSYPPYVTNAEERHRWDLAQGIADLIFGDDGAAASWSATRSLYSGEIPTD